MNVMYKYGQLNDVSVSETEDGRRIVEGYFGDDNVDSVGHMIEREPYIDAMRDFLNWGNIRDSHGEACGKLVEWGNKAWNHIVVEIVDDKVWNLIKTGVYKGFSIGARAFKIEPVETKTIPYEKFKNMTKTVFDAIQEVGYVLVIKALEIVEISVTDRPANRAALFTKDINVDQINELPSVFDVSLFKEILKMEQVTNEAENVTQPVVADETQHNEDVVVSEDTTEKSTEVTFDAQAAFDLLKSEVEQKFNDINTQLATIETLQKTLNETLVIVNDIVSKISEKTESVDSAETEQTTEQPVAQTEVVEQKSLDIDALTEKITKSVVEQIKTVVAGLSVERQNTVNAGVDGIEAVVEVQKDAFDKLAPFEKFKVVATNIAKQARK